MRAWSNQGFSIVSLLIASAVVAASFLAINSVMFGSFKSSMKNRVVARQIAIESGLIVYYHNPPSTGKRYFLAHSNGNDPTSCHYPGVSLQRHGFFQYNARLNLGLIFVQSFSNHMTVRIQNACLRIRASNYTS